jgi:hypothetical protein
MWPDDIFLVFFINRHGHFLVSPLRGCGGCCHRQNLEDRKENKMPMTMKKTLRKIHQPKSRKK